MKKMVLGFILCAVASGAVVPGAVAPVWAQQSSSQAIALEKKLAAVEVETEGMRIGKEELLADLQEMDAAVRPQTCAALNQSVTALKKEISDLQKQLAELEQPANYALLDEQQKARLVEQKMFLNEHNPAIDCQKL